MDNWKIRSQIREKEEKIKLFRGYFRGRSDVYAYLSVDKVNSFKKYYINACQNEWKKGVCNKTMGRPCKICRFRLNAPLTDKVIERHLFGDKTIGIYPMTEAEECAFLAVEFDNRVCVGDVKDGVLSFVSVCDSCNIDVLISKNSFDGGVTCFIFFKSMVKGYIARKLGSLLLSKAIERYANLSFDIFDRMTPNQDFLPKGGLGNLIILPFKENSGGIVSSDFKIINDVFGYLSGLRKLTERDVAVCINLLLETTVDISHDDYDVITDVRNKRKNNIEFPAELDVILDNMVYISKENLSPVSKNCFRRLASFANPEFYKRERLRLPIYNVPMIIDCSREDKAYLKLPRGTLEYLEVLCHEHGVKMNIHDNRNLGVRIDYKFSGVLKEEQEKALENLIKYETGILKAPTGFGKTVICCKLIEVRHTNTLIITEKLQILRQWKEKITKFLNVPVVGQIGGGKNVVTNQIDVASIRSIWNKGNFNDIVRNYGLIIIDECHHLAAFTYESAVNTVNSKYVYGVTATPDRENGHTPIIKMQCGDIRYEVDAKGFNKSLDFVMKVYVKNNKLRYENKEIKDYTMNEINKLIVSDERRNKRIIDDVTREFGKGKNILVLTERLEHLDYLYNNLSSLTNNIFAYHGGISRKILKEYQEREDAIISKGDNKIIVATGSYIGEGFDDDTLDVLFLTMPVSGITRVTQYTGRLHRMNENKKEIIVYDYVDDNFRQTRNMFEKRRMTYEKLGYSIFW